MPTIPPLDLNSPHRVLEAILDEVEGLRRTDPASRLPQHLITAIREHVIPQPVIKGHSIIPSSSALGSISDAEGKTVRSVFECCGVEAVLVFTDGSFLALDCDGDEDATIDVRCRTPLTELVSPRDLLRAGLINQDVHDRLNAEKAERNARAAMHRAARAQLEFDEARRKLEEAQRAAGITPTPAPTAAPTTEATGG